MLLTSRLEAIVQIQTYHEVWHLLAEVSFEVVIFIESNLLLTQYSWYLHRQAELVYTTHSTP
jgi:hypothetical protein